MRSHIDRRQAFTLVELLVVIAIIGTLMGLLLPAVQSAREAGRRNTCANNVAQLSKAVTAFDGKYGYIPGWRNAIVWKNPTTLVTGTSMCTWAVPLMPHIERTDIYDALQRNDNVSNIVIPLLLCPTSPPEEINTSMAFVGNCGNLGAGQKGDGVMFNVASGKKIGLDYITNGDGATNTLLFSERNGDAATQPQWINAPESPSPPFIYNASVYTNAGMVHSTDPDQQAPSGKVINSGTLAPYAYPSAMHSGGVTAGFCDGHVIFLRDTVDGKVYSQLLTSKTSGATAVYQTLGLLNAADF